MKKILITGKNSYIGTSLEKWLLKTPGEYQVESFDMRDDSWKLKDFSEFDVVFHVAGIAHVSSDPKLEDLYYKVNRDLTIETAKKARSEGVGQFIFMSSIIVYGDNNSNNKVIDKRTIPCPVNYYGNSKLQAEEGIRKLNSEHFKVAVIRPPMIYGKGSKGNYPKLVKLAKTIPVFPKVNNQRSMLHIDNLCELIKNLIKYEDSGLFFPQNKEYVNTSLMVKEISDLYGKKMWITILLNPLLIPFYKIDIFRKIFGTLVYEKTMSEYKNADYRIREFKESIKLTELERN